MSRSFRVDPEFLEVSTRNYPNVECPSFRVPVVIWDNATKRFAPKAANFLWDTGSSLCILGRRAAENYSLRLHEMDDRIPDGIGGMGGSQSAWLTTMKVRFPLLSKRRREPDLAFNFHVIVVDRLEFPILGTRDLLQNFSVESTWDGTTFTLNRNHRGEAI